MSKDTIRLSHRKALVECRKFDLWSPRCEGASFKGALLAAVHKGILQPHQNAREVPPVFFAPNKVGGDVRGSA